ncbi:DNA-3-methyladenine glycosylase I [Candidatus Lokiarchaeum ossiferum]|uniref:DNA-3-methyladenine glycosylase I n=1 Tax=Candidatus Lokiarchaeum ossiferum TaxID=2951803 RepID=UPI00352D9019
MVKKRCWGTKDDLMGKYHDNEWGIPLHDDNKLFELLILEGAQAGLSWSTILNKRENYRQAFDHFNYKKIAKYSQSKIEELLQNSGIIRNKLKVNAAVTNAKIFMKIQEEFGSFDKYIWSYVNGTPIQNNLKSFSEMPAKTELSEQISKDMKKKGFKFVGPTIIYSFMQAIGMVNDHLTYCYRHQELK